MRSVFGETLSLTFQPKRHHPDVCKERWIRKCVSVGLFSGSVSGYLMTPCIRASPTAHFKNLYFALPPAPHFEWPQGLVLLSHEPCPRWHWSTVHFFSARELCSGDVDNMDVIRGKSQVSYGCKHLGNGDKKIRTSVSLCYIASSRSAWATGDPVSQNKTKSQEK